MNNAPTKFFLSCYIKYPEIRKPQTHSIICKSVAKNILGPLWLRGYFFPGYTFKAASKQSIALLIASAFSTYANLTSSLPKPLVL